MSIKTLTETLADLPILDEPEVEVLRGVEVPKVSPRRRHGRLQMAMAAMLEAWAGDNGEVATEWRFWLSRGPGAEETTLVPDVAFVTHERMSTLSNEDAEEPPFAPTLAVEIRSPGDRDRNVRTKASLYLAAGSLLVLDVDSARLRIVAFDRRGERTFTEDDAFAHESLPGLTFAVAEFFARGDRKRR
jgi:Uma2 family endonuclease